MEQNTAQTSLEKLARLVEEHKDSALAEIPVPQELMKQILEGFRETMGHLQTIHRQFMRCEKMAALGNLMAGIAHEISTPVASINSNTDLFTRSLSKIKATLSSDNMPAELREVVCAAFAVSAAAAAPGAGELSRTRELSQEKYTAEAWIRRR